MTTGEAEAAVLVVADLDNGVLSRMDSGLRARPAQRLGASHTAGVVLALVVAAALALVVGVGSSVVQASPASADPAPVGPGIGCPPEATNTAPDSGALLDKIVPGQSPASRPGCFPTSAYRIDFHQDSGVKALLSPADNMMGWFTDFLFGLTRLLVAVGLWVVEWVFTFGFAGRLAQPAADIAARYQSNLAGPLVSFALTLAAVYGGFHILRGRLGKGAGEFGLSLFVVAFAGAFVLSQPKTFLDGALKTTGALSGSVVSLAVNCGNQCNYSVRMGCPTGAPRDACPVPLAVLPGPPVSGGAEETYIFDQYVGLVHPLERGIHQAFIEQPYQLLQWGQAVPPGECTHRMNEILAKSPGGNRNNIIHIMGTGEMGKSGGGLADAIQGPIGKAVADWLFGSSSDLDGTCDALYKFNTQPSMERLGMAALALFAAIVIMVLLVLVAGTVVAAQLVAVVLIALTPFAVLGGALPGAGRQMLWRWMAGFARTLLTILLMSAFLAFLLVTTQAVFDTTTGDALLVRMAALNLVTIVAFVARKRMLAAGQRVATNFGQRLGSASVGGHRSSWMAPAAVGGATGFALSQHLREMSVEGHQVTGPLGRKLIRGLHNREQGNALAKAMRAAGMAGGGAAATYVDNGSNASHTFNNLHVHMPGSGPGTGDPDDFIDAEVVDDDDIVDADAVAPPELVGAGAAGHRSSR